jgi:hypothetical protein
MDFLYKRMIIVGSTSSGKSTSAKKLAYELALKFIELDTLHCKEIRAVDSAHSGAPLHAKYMGKEYRIILDKLYVIPIGFSLTGCARPIGGVKVNTVSCCQNRASFIKGIPLQVPARGGRVVNKQHYLKGK